MLKQCLKVHMHTHKHRYTFSSTFPSTYSAKHLSSSIRFVHSLIKKYWLTSDFLSKHHLYWKCMQVCPLYFCSPCERRTPQTLSWPYNWWSTAKGKQIENQCRWHRWNENEAWCGEGRGGGPASLSGQRVEGANTQAQGKLSPSCPPTPPSQFIYRAQMGWDQ